jgi:hypothetical protein
MEHTVGIDGAVLTLGDIEQMRPTGEIREVEVEVIGLSQGVQISGVESEDIRCVKGAQGSHLDVASGRDLSRSLVTRLRDVMKKWRGILTSGRPVWVPHYLAKLQGDKEG